MLAISCVPLFNILIFYLCHVFVSSCSSEFHQKHMLTEAQPGMYSTVPKISIAEDILTHYSILEGRESRVNQKQHKQQSSHTHHEKEEETYQPSLQCCFTECIFIKFHYSWCSLDSGHALWILFRAWTATVEFGPGAGIQTGLWPSYVQELADSKRTFFFSFQDV